MIAADEHIALHHLTRAHAPFLQRLMNEPSWLANIGDRGIRSLADAERFIAEKIRPAYEAQGYGMYALTRAKDETPLGVCGLFRREVLPLPDLGFALLPEYWGQGLACAAARLTLRHAHEVLGLRRLLAITAPHNERSARLLQRLGFVCTGSVRLAPDAETLQLYDSGELAP